jgi:CheY-like chemotaxis protein
MTARSTGIQILVAEDNPADVYLIEEALRQKKILCDVTILSNGAEVLRFLEGFNLDLQSACPDLFLLDLRLPAHDGAEILERLRSSARCARIPVIVMTSSDSPDDEECARRHSAVHYFRKPRNLSQFMELGTIVKTLLLS